MFVSTSNPKADESVAMTFPTTMNDPVSYSQGREKRLALKPYLICKASSVHQSMMIWKKSPFSKLSQKELLGKTTLDVPNFACQNFTK